MDTIEEAVAGERERQIGNLKVWVGLNLPGNRGVKKPKVCVCSLNDL